MENKEVFEVENGRKIETTKNEEVIVSLHHEAHEHLLIFKSSVANAGSIGCRGCWRLIKGPHYACEEGCNYFLHSTCAQLPKEIDHPLHIQHRLRILWSPPQYPGDVCECRACGKNCRGFTYHCLHCTRFDIDLLCAWLPRRLDSRSSHYHPYTLFLKPAAFLCDACHVESGTKSISYLCFECRFWVHLDCALPPDRLAKVCNNHLLEFIDISYPPRPYRGQDCFVCKSQLYVISMDRQDRALFLNRQREAFVYTCGSCDTYFHVGCVTLATRALLSADASVMGKMKDSGKDISKTLLWMQRVQEQIDEATKSRESRIEHWSHEHCLELSTTTDELPRFDRSRIRCNGCKWPLLAPFYRCRICKFFLHAECAELRKAIRSNYWGEDDHSYIHELDRDLEIQFPSGGKGFQRHYPHSHSLSLHMIDDTERTCSNCDKSYSGFSYDCQDCVYMLDLSCAAIARRVVHQAHDHFLYVSYQGKPSKKCQACGKLCIKTTYFCSLCEFYLHTTCASLPTISRHPYDHHLLNLMFESAKNELGEYICDICEDDKRNPNNWFYGCEKCDFAAHVDCVYNQG